MHSLPVCAYVALWATSAYTTGEPAAGLVFQACPGADAFAGDHDRLDLWREAGETVVCAAFPTPGHAHGMPRTSPAALAAVTASGQCLIAPSVGALLVPQTTRHGPGVGPAEDVARVVTWTAYDAEPLPRHILEMIELAELSRRLLTSTTAAAEALARAGGTPWSGEVRDIATAGQAGVRLPPRTPPGTVRTIVQAARVRAIVALGLAESTRLDGPVDVFTAGRREEEMRRLGVVADEVLGGAVTVAAMAMAGWRPA